jgi:hypothetical protein
MVEYDWEKDENCLMCVLDNERLYYTIVQRDPELSNTGKSIIRRILRDRHEFIGDFYKTQSYFMIKYIDDDNIKVDRKYHGSDRNEITIDEFNDYLINNVYDYMYMYDVSKDLLLIKEKNLEEYHIDFHNRKDVEDFLDSIN